YTQVACDWPPRWVPPITCSGRRAPLAAPASRTIFSSSPDVTVEASPSVHDACTPASARIAEVSRAAFWNAYGAVSRTSIQTRRRRGPAARARSRDTEETSGGRRRGRSVSPADANRARAPPRRHAARTARTRTPPLESPTAGSFPPPVAPHRAGAGPCAVGQDAGGEGTVLTPERGWSGVVDERASHVRTTSKRSV